MEQALQQIANYWWRAKEKDAEFAAYLECRLSPLGITFTMSETERRVYIGKSKGLFTRPEIIYDTLTDILEWLPSVYPIPRFAEATSERD